MNILQEFSLLQKTRFRQPENYNLIKNESNRVVNLQFLPARELVSIAEYTSPFAVRTRAVRILQCSSRMAPEDEMLFKNRERSINGTISAWARCKKFLLAGLTDNF